MKISVKNIGLIARADIELNGVTVIGGYNSSGKSTVLKAVYALLYSNQNIKAKIEKERERSFVRAVRSADDLIGFLFRKPSDALAFYEEIRDIREKEQEITLEAICKMINTKIRREAEQDFNVLELNGYDEVREVTAEQIKGLYETIEKIIQRSDSEYERFIFTRNFQNIFYRNINTFQCLENARAEIQIDMNGSFAEFADNKMISYRSYPNITDSVWYLNTVHITDMLEYGKMPSVMCNELKKALTRRVDQDIWYELFNDIEENTETFTDILKEILHGELDVSESRRGVVYKDEELNTSFEIENVASGMKNLLVIQKLLQNGSLKRNSILLIDEPESNLHPEWQVKLAEVLVLLNKELNVKILINSHSPYFMRAMEVSLAEHAMKERGKFYIMREQAAGRFYAEDVTANTNEIYEMLYKPLEYL